MAITVKKKKMTVKTVKAKGRIPDGAEAKAPAPEEAAPAAAAPRRAGRPQVDGRVYTFSVVLAIISILMFIGLITLQALELHFYYRPPNPVFLRQTVPTGAGGPGPSTAPPPPEDVPVDSE